MLNKIKNILFDNLGWKLMAFFLAVLTWAIITGGERISAEKNFRLPVEIVNISPTIEVKSIRPEAIQVTLTGPASRLNQITADKLQLKIDLKGISESTKLNFFAEDYLIQPQGLSISSIHPKMIEIAVVEFIAKEVPVKVRFKGKLAKNLEIKQIGIHPEKVTIIGYKSEIKDIETVLTEEINLSEIKKSTTLKVGLLQPKSILKFKEPKEVEVTLLITETNG